MSEGTINTFCIGHEKTFFWATYILYIILGLTAIILTGMVLKGGTSNKAVLWALYAFSILLFVGAVFALTKGHKWYGTIFLLLQFITSLAALIMTNTYGNVSSVDTSGHFATTGKYSLAIIFTIMTFLVGIPAVYFNKAVF